MMKLSDLGFDQWFEAHVSDFRQEGRGIARISAVDRGSYLIRNELGEVPAELAGKLYFQVESSYRNRTVLSGPQLQVVN
jgi:ribosome biogenesis GTPase / thiamine phosphate phosphatase